MATSSLMQNAIEYAERYAVKYSEQYGWEVMITLGIAAQARLDEARWTIGDLALLVEKCYGEDALGKFAYAINVPKKRVEEYRTICRFWDRQTSARADILDRLATITYSHMRAATRFATHDEAVEFIEECAANDWRVEQANAEISKRLGKPAAPRKILEMEFEPMDYKKVAWLSSALANHDQRQRLEAVIDNKKARFRVVIYAVEEEVQK